MPDHDLLTASSKRGHDPDHADNARKQRRERGTRDSPAEAEDKDRVSHDIHHICAHRNQHRKTAVTAGSVKRAACLKQRKERKRNRSEGEVRNGISHDFFVHTAEDQAQERLIEGKTKRPRSTREHRDCKEDLLCGAVCFADIALPDEMRADNRAAGGESREELDEQHVD